MNQEVLYISFLLGAKKDEFNLNVSSYFPLQVGGVDWENTYNLKLDNEFYLFLLYLENKYDKHLKLVEDVIEATVKETNRGINNKNLPWIYTLVVQENNITETIEFFPYECTLLGKIEDGM